MMSKREELERAQSELIHMVEQYEENNNPPVLTTLTDLARQRLKERLGTVRTELQTLNEGE